MKRLIMGTAKPDNSSSTSTALTHTHTQHTGYNHNRNLNKVTFVNTVLISNDVSRVGPNTGLR